jgi:hypothetical protein
VTRAIPDPGFAGDAGAADPEVTAALAAYATDESRYVDALAALQGARLLVPVVAVATEVEHDADGRARDKTSDMATVLMTSRSGRRGLLAFTGLEPLRAWSPEARPVPVATRLAARSALQEGAEALVIDIAGPSTVAIEGDDLAGMAGGWQLARVGVRTAWIRPPGE